MHRAPCTVTAVCLLTLACEPMALADEVIAVEEIFDTWVAADPDTWNASGDVTDVDNPFTRMLDATGQGTGGDFDTLSATHGTNR